ncbi:MAG: methylmalonyl-CoA mutase family protein [Desulfobacterales bacterium]|nr:methylmalonyl-CoA mutase family protein [Desulfobacterales bacterium]
MAIDTLEDFLALIEGHPAGPGHDLHDDQSAGHGPLGDVLRGGRDQGRAADQDRRHDPERHAQGVHRAEDLHVPAGTLGEAHQRHGRVRHQVCSQLEHHQHQRLPHPRSRRHGGPGAGLHAPRRHRIRRRRHPPQEARTLMTLPRGSPSSSIRTSTSSRRSARLRAARRIWAKVMRDRFKAKNPRSWWMRFHTQTAGCSLTAQQPYNNVVRTTVEALAAVLGGTQSLHTNSLDEVLCLPSEHAVEIALRTQQILAEETGVANTIDPLAGSYFVEALTNEMEEKAWEYIHKIDDMGGMIAAIEKGFPQMEIADAAYKFQRQIDSERKDHGRRQQICHRRASIRFRFVEIDEKIGEEQIERLQDVRRKRDSQRRQEVRSTILKTPAKRAKT